MTPESWKRVAALFTAITEQPEADWSRLLDQFCGRQDSEERRQIERLLSVERRDSPSHLDRPAARISDAVPDTGPRSMSSIPPSRPNEIAGYRLLQPLGQGAISVVYLALCEGDAYRQRVAIKLIRSEIDDPSAIRRFLSERQILAQLEHPNIARLLGGGDAEDGRPYLVMEYIDGLPITDYCDRQQLDVEARLRLFLDVCCAVQHAHQSLLVHRDLKPGNILVTADGMVKLLDFGIAKILAPWDGLDPRTTQTGHRPMTPGYASPEQVRGAVITTATDVYSLGVLLFEILTGARPYRLKAEMPHELEHAICEVAPRSPSSTLGPKSGLEPTAISLRARARASTPAELRRRLQGDLDTIVARALSKNPERRYPSALQLAEDIERHLANRPIHARQDHPGYRLAKFVRRHRTVVSISAVAVALIAVLALLLHRQSTFLESRRVTTERVTELFVDRLAAPDSETQSTQPIPREALDASLTEIAPRFGDDRSRLAEMLETMGWVYRRAGLTEDARWLFEQALEQHQLAASAAHRVAGSRHALGKLLFESGDVAAGEKELQQALVELRRSDSSRTSYVLAEILEALGRHEWWAGDLDEAESLLAESIEVKKRICPQASWTARGLSELGQLHLERQQFAAAEPLLADAEALRRRLSSGNREMARNLEDRALRAFAAGRLTEAEEAAASAIAMRRNRFGLYQVEIIDDLVLQARTLLPRGLHQEAIVLLREALSIHRGLALGHGPRLARILKHLGRGLVASGETDGGEALLREVLELEGGWLSADHPRMAVTRLWLGRALHARGALVEADRLLTRAATDLRGQPEWDFGLGLEARVALADLRIERGEWSAAESSLEQTLQLARSTHPEGHWRISLISSRLGSTVARQAQAESLAPVHALATSG